ncbi:uncharacterized protein LOC131660382 [Vicia villosa]|uniref:uncharacterized protein LOC131660382 n=1 Tax=Vicia villosa TaxID=3911 RepID=UPI00273C3544|nr:uncharacterized protein LOC131660382 [Vicia villosa]
MAEASTEKFISERELTAETESESDDKQKKSTKYERDKSEKLFILEKSNLALKIKVFKLEEEISSIASVTDKILVVYVKKSTPSSSSQENQDWILAVTPYKLKASWNNDDRRRVLQGALSMDEFFRVSACTTAKKIWDTLVETHEGTAEVKRSRLNTLSQEYELFRMQPGESILELQKRFVHLINNLSALGNKVSTEEQNIKVLRSLTREWQPKVTAISEKENLSRMTSTTLLGKLQEYETELGRLEKHEIQRKKDKRPNKAYVAWDDNEVSSSSDSKSKEYANLAFMALHHSNDENDEVSNEFSIYDNDVQGAINELLNECKMLYRTVSTQEKQIKSLEEKIDTMQNDFEVEKKQYVDKEKQKSTSSIKCQKLPIMDQGGALIKGELSLLKGA